MDYFTFWDASLFYPMFFSPLLTIALVLFWMSANMKNTARAQLIGIVILVIIGILAINSPLILIIEAIAVVLLAIWIIYYKNSFLKGQLSVFLYLFVLQLIYYRLFMVLVGYNQAILLLCIIPILSMILLYPWTYGSKKTANGRVFLVIAFIVQAIFLILTILFAIIATVNS